MCYGVDEGRNAKDDGMNETEIAEVINVLRQEFVKQANGAEAMKFEYAVHATFPFATDWIPPEQDFIRD